MSNYDFDIERDFALDDITVNETVYNVNQNNLPTTVIGFYVEKDASWMINDGLYGDALAATLPASAVYNQLQGFLYPSVSADSIPQAHDTASLQTGAKVIMISKPHLQDRIKPGTLTANFRVPGDGGLSAYHDMLASGVTGSISPMGELRGALTGSTSSQIIGSVFYDYGIVLIHGSNGTTDWSSKTININSNTISGLKFSTATATTHLSVDLHFASEKMVRRGQYFAHVYNKDANFSTNPTFGNASGAVESNLTANPTTFISSVGMYNDNGELLAIAKVSPPVKKDFNSEAVFKINLEY